MKTIEFKAAEFETQTDAFHHIDAHPDPDKVLIRIFARYCPDRGPYFVTTRDEAHRLAEAGIEFSYLYKVVRSDGTKGLVVAVPIN